jgi:hypothetical protein
MTSKLLIHTLSTWVFNRSSLQTTSVLYVHRYSPSPVLEFWLDTFNQVSVIESISCQILSYETLQLVTFCFQMLYIDVTINKMLWLTIKIRLTRLFTICPCTDTSREGVLSFTDFIFDISTTLSGGIALSLMWQSGTSRSIFTCKGWRHSAHNHDC